MVSAPSGFYTKWFPHLTPAEPTLAWPIALCFAQFAVTVQSVAAAAGLLARAV
jgi:hypothetical protein